MSNQGADMTQPEALRLANEYRPSMPQDVLHQWAADVVIELRRLHAENEELRRDADRYRWLLEQAWFQSAFERYDISDDGTIPGFTSECARVIDAAMKGQS